MLHSQSYQTAFAQQPPSRRSNVATTSVQRPVNLQICMNPFSLSVRATNSSLEVDGATALAIHPDVVVGVRNSWDKMPPVSEMENALIYPERLERWDREVAQMYEWEYDNWTSSDQYSLFGYPITGRSAQIRLWKRSNEQSRYANLPGGIKGNDLVYASVLVFGSMM